MIKMAKKWFKEHPRRDTNYYFGLLLLTAGILSLVVYLLIDAFVPLSFLITFLICGWGFVLLWKSDNDFRFAQAQERILLLEAELDYLKMFTTPPHLLSRGRRLRVVKEK